jgi:hypothetical protein
MTSFNAFVVSCSLTLLAACGDSGSGGAGGGEAAIGGAGGAPGAALSAPILDELEPVHGALHVYWTNVTTDCDMVHAERKTDTDPYAEAFLVPGNVDNKADQDAMDIAVTYTYRLACEKGGVMSDYSNELSGSPE